MPRLLSLAAALALCGCQLAKDANSKEPELQLRSYKVAPGSAQQLRSILRAVLFLEKEKSVGRVEASPDGQLVVLGTPPIQKGAQELIEQYGTRAAPPGVELTYWLVRSSAAAKAETPPELAEVQPALAALPPAPPQKFELVEKVRLSSLADEHAQVMGRTIEVWQQASLIGDKVLAELHLSQPGKPGRVETRVQLVPGQLLVLAEAGARGEPGQLLYLVKAGVVPGK